MDNSTYTESEVDAMLTSISEMTDEIRELQAAIRERGAKRREIIVGLSGVTTYSRIAKKMGCTEQNVYKILHRNAV